MINTVLCDMLDITQTIIQGGMAWVATAQLAAAVSEEGGLGVIGAGNAPTEWVAEEVSNCIRAFVEQKKSEVVELNVQVDHVHLLAMVPPKVAISDFVGTIKGRTAIRVFNKFRHLKRKPYWGNHFWAKGYCVDTVGLDEEKIRKYVKYQERKERLVEQDRLV